MGEVTRINEAMEKERAKAQAEREESDEKYKKQLQDLEKKNSEERKQMRKHLEEQKKEMERDLDEKMAEHRRQMDTLKMNDQRLQNIHQQMMLADDYSPFGGGDSRGHRKHGRSSKTRDKHDGDYCNGRRVHTGPRGGKYVLTSSGGKRYIPRD